MKSSIGILVLVLIILIIPNIVTPSGTIENNDIHVTWSGTWNTTFGTMVLAFEGTTLTGKYFQKGGVTSGIVAEDVYVGIWSENPTYSTPNDSGDFELILDNSGQSFSGWKRYGAAGNRIVWNGVRIHQDTPLLPQVMGCDCSCVKTLTCGIRCGYS
ncbi:MAG TPA: hypothetical protein VN372_02450 [Methanospirillum sp.]|nr:hypothetical protein [Methanospirillum sp.]